MLSVGKLCEFAQTVESDPHSLPPDAFIGALILQTQPSDAQLLDGIFAAYDNKLELLAVMQRLREELESSLPQDEPGTVEHLDLDIWS